MSSKPPDTQLAHEFASVLFDVYQGNRFTINDVRKAAIFNPRVAALLAAINASIPEGERKAVRVYGTTIAQHVRAGSESVDGFVLVVDRSKPGETVRSCGYTFTPRAEVETVPTPDASDGFTQERAFLEMHARIVSIEQRLLRIGHRVDVLIDRLASLLPIGAPNDG